MKFSDQRIGDSFRDNRLSKLPVLNFLNLGGPKISQKQTVSFPSADATVTPSGLCRKTSTDKRSTNVFLLQVRI